MRTSLRVDDRSCRHADLWRHLPAPAVIRRSFPGAQHTDAPVLLSRIGIEGIHTVMLRRRVDDVVPARGKTNTSNIERLRVNLSINGKIEAESEGRRPHIRWRENRLCLILSCS